MGWRKKFLNALRILYKNIHKVRIPFISAKRLSCILQLDLNLGLIDLTTKIDNLDVGEWRYEMFNQEDKTAIQKYSDCLENAWVKFMKLVMSVNK